MVHAAWGIPLYNGGTAFTECDESASSSGNFTTIKGLSVERKSGEARIRQLLEALRLYQPEQVYLFGSWARGEEDELSDLDVVVIKHTTAPFFDRLREVGALLPTDLGAVDVLVYTPEEFAVMRKDGNAFAEMIAEEARLIYGSSTKG